MLIAIDHGNYAIKTPNHSFVSGLSEHTVKPPMADEILEYDGRYWTTSGKRLSYMRDKTQDERYFILTLFAIAKELEDTGRYSPVEQIQLAVGLPPEHYGVLKDKFARYFKRDGIIKFVYKDKPYSIMIDKVMVFPQAYAAVVPKSSMVVNIFTHEATVSHRGVVWSFFIIPFGRRGVRCSDRCDNHRNDQPLFYSQHAIMACCVYRCKTCREAVCFLPAVVACQKEAWKWTTDRIIPNGMSYGQSLLGGLKK